MIEKKGFSLSYYFEELTQKKTKINQRGMLSEETISTTARIEVLKALKQTDKKKLSLTALARSVNLKIASCQEVVEYLRKEGLVEIETDEETGNDLVKLTQKGTQLL
jgi:predicted transcriptional regulator